MTSYTFWADLAATVPDVPTDSIISRTVFKDKTLQAIVFGFAAGQTLSEHTSAFPAVLHILSDQARLTLGEDAHAVEAGAWVHMPPHLPHSVVAETPLTMLLLLLRPGS